MTRPTPSYVQPHILISAAAAVTYLGGLKVPLASGFVLQPHHVHHHVGHVGGTALYDISEWRDLMFDYPADGDSSDRLGVVGSGSEATNTAPPREVNILPFPFDQILLQGETKQLRLYEDRFIKLFEDTQANHCGVVAMGLMASSGIVQKVPLCEIEAYNRMDTFGIFVTIRVVGRAELIDIKQQSPYIKAVCREVSDSIPPNLELPNMLAKQIEDSMCLLSKMENALEEAEEKSNGGDGMKARITRAKLEDRFYEERDEDLDDDDDEDDDDDDLDPQLDRQNRYQTAYRTALRTDTQGYCVTDSTGYGKSPQELTAISWAAFCTDIVPEATPTARIQAMDTDNLFERLKLASHTLKQQESALKAQLVKAGIDIDDDDDDSNGSQEASGTSEGGNK